MIIIEKLILRECFYRTLIVLFAIMGLFVVFDSLDSMRDLIAQGLSSSLFYWKIFLSLPARLYELLPLAVLLGCIWGISVLGKSSELTVMFASGFLVKRLMVLLLIFGAVFGLAGVFVDEVLDYFAKQKYQSVFISKDPLKREKTWLRFQQNFIRFESLNANIANDIITIKLDKDFSTIVSIIKAKRGEYKYQASGGLSSNGQWYLHEVEELIFNKNLKDNLVFIKNEITSEKLNKLISEFEKKSAPYFKNTYPELIWKESPKIDYFYNQDQRPDRLKLFQLIPLYKFNLDNLLRFEALAVNMWKKINYPLVIALMAIIGLPFCLKSGRAIEANFRVLLGIIIGIVFFVIQGIFANLGIIILPPFASVIFPIIVFFIFSLIGIWWAERR